MSDSTYLVSVPVTPEYVLAVFRDQHRQVARFDYCCDSTIDLTLDSTIEDWRNACDLLETRDLGRAMNESWKINHSDAEWRAVLHPPRQRTLRGVAELIARHATRNELCPLSIVGMRCLPAAAFLAVKDCLAGNGVDVSNLAPSTALCEYTRRNLVAFIDPISRLAPGALPDVDVKLPDEGALLLPWFIRIALVLMGLITSMAGGNPVPFNVMALLLLLFEIVGSWFQKPRELTSVTFGELRTFRDLAYCIAAGVTTRPTAV
jgi:hypothetical protein